MRLSLINTLLLLLVTLTSSIAFALTEIEKLRENNFLSNIKPITVEKVDRIITACKEDMKSSWKLTRQEQNLCKSFFKAELYARQSYDHLIDSCAYRKLSASATLNSHIYDQMFINFLSQNKAIYLLHRRDPESIIKLNEYKHRFASKISKTEKNHFLKLCKKEMSFQNHRQRILTFYTVL
jgi:hypothetical protein